MVQTYGKKLHPAVKSILMTLGHSSYGIRLIHVVLRIHHFIIEMKHRPSHLKLENIQTGNLPKMIEESLNSIQHSQ
jgi:hypothetical protein